MDTNKRFACLAVQARVAKVFPSRYWATMLTCLIGSVESFAVGIFLGHDKAQWRLKWDLQLLTVVYSVCSYAIPDPV